MTKQLNISTLNAN